MGISVNISKKLDSDNVQVEVSSPKIPTRYFKVPKAKADEFCAKYKDNYSSSTLYSTMLITGTTMAACLIANTLTKNLEKIYRYGIGLATGVASVLATTAGTARWSVHKEEKFLKNYNATEIKYQRKEFPI